MELLIVLTAVLFLWTNATLFPPPPKRKSVEQTLVEALKDYLEVGIRTRS
jgi:hypothetical protein